MSEARRFTACDITDDVQNFRLHDIGTEYVIAAAYDKLRSLLRCVQREAVLGGVSEETMTAIDAAIGADP